MSNYYKDNYNLSNFLLSDINLMDSHLECKVLNHNCKTYNCISHHSQYYLTELLCSPQRINFHRCQLELLNHSDMNLHMSALKDLMAKCITYIKSYHLSTKHMGFHKVHTLLLFRQLYWLDMRPSMNCCTIICH